MNTLGIDIGGTKTSIGIVDIKNGRTLDKKIIPSKKYKNDNKNLEFIVKTSLELIKDKNIKKIGIGVPELINNNGIIKGNYNFNWNNRNLANYFPNNLNIKVDSDVRCHLRAEKFYGLAKKYKNFIYINIGSGLSYAQFSNNKINSGGNGYAIHFASSQIYLYDWKKNKKLSLVPEDYYSGKEILIINKKFKNMKKNNLIIDNVAKSIGSMVANLVNTVDPQNIVLGGGVIIKNTKLKKLIIKHTRVFILPKELKKIKMQTSKLKDDTGLIGAASIFKRI